MSQPSIATHDRVRVWIVEDDDDYRCELKALINEQPDLFCDYEFSSAEALFERLSEPRATAPNIVLLDIGLPGMDGIEALEELVRVAPTTEVAMVTVHDDRDRIFRAFSAGASGYLTKDTPRERIVESVQDVAHGGAAMSPKIAADLLRLIARLNSPPRDYGLTPREMDVLHELCLGKQKATIARDLGVAFATVDAHMRSIYRKLDVSTAVGAVIVAFRHNVLGNPVWQESDSTKQASEEPKKGRARWGMGRQK